LDLEGMKRSRKKIGEADIAVLVLDAASGVTDEDNDIYEMIKDKKSVIVINKTDRGALITREQAEKIYGAAHFVETSVVTGRGLEELEKRIGAILQEKEVIVPEGPIVTNIRYKEALELALAGIERAMKVTGEGFNPELLASDLSETIYSLGYITGETIKDDILERIFSRFCIGK
jgi:tRNA modification GTPase